MGLLDDLFDDQLVAPPEDPEEVFRILSNNCTACPLSLLAPHNQGFYAMGDLKARVAFLSDFPTLSTQRKGYVLSHAEEAEFREWLPVMGLSSDGILMTNVIQCPTGDDPDKEVQPDRKRELNVCFPNRALRMLQAMRNLEAVVTLGIVAGGAMRGMMRPSLKEMEGIWIRSNMLPGVAIYGLPHPRDFREGMSWDEKGRLYQVLEYFNLDYSLDKKIIRVMGQAA